MFIAGGMPGQDQDKERIAMNHFPTWVLIAGLAGLAGCGGTDVRETKKETVIEKQVPVSEPRREIIVTTPPVVVVPSQLSCTYASATFYAGTLSCQAGRLVRCIDGAWAREGSC